MQSASQDMQLLLQFCTHFAEFAISFYCFILPLITDAHSDVSTLVLDRSSCCACFLHSRFSKQASSTSHFAMVVLSYKGIEFILYCCNFATII
jgi:hypothetical protein